ncbi:hypothetical protein EW145_g6948 [Phellinidium pouzarii]|uniref:histone deacetylase n=1 Tax=Phellinidium pouzarii TaxID=167371 RepID=A0A4S4KSA3_9AGAM|nr:hypothetical protein EW145_g6948 [Phellinidium pouzarii]
MSSLFNAVANGVSGLMRVGSQPQASSEPSSATTVPEKSANPSSEAQTSNGVLVPEQSEPEAMDIDSNIQSIDVKPPDQDKLQPAAGPLDSHTSTDSIAPIPDPSNVARASSVPYGRHDAPKLRFGYVYDDRMMLHSPLEYHPEAPARIHGIHQKLRNAGCLSRMKLIPVRMVRKMEALLVHSEDHWEKIQMIAQMTPEQISLSESYYEHLSLYVCPKTTLAAQLSCGGVIEAALAVARGELEKSFAIVRPPGHHAEPEEHMGFCFFNNVSVAARVVQQLTPIKRVMILDCKIIDDTSNGTQRAFLDDPSVLYVSLHRFDGGRFYPCGPFGGMDSCGEGPGEGTSVNIPWPEKGMGDAEYLHAFMKIVMPIAMEFAPELVIISAGFDAADGDELGECHITPTGYAHMTHMLSTLAGGEACCCLRVTRVLLGDAPPELKPLVANETGTETVWAVATYQSRYWKSLDPKACEPREEYPEQTVSIPELLKLHRQEYLYQIYRMVQVPLLDTEVDERFQTQVICSADVMEKDTLVLFVHQLWVLMHLLGISLISIIPYNTPFSSSGNLRVELAGALTCDVKLEYSYLIDVTKDLVDWVHKKNFAYVEVNTYPRPLQHNHKRSWSELAREVVTYLWDNYIQISNASQIILIGHGPGCSAVMDLMAARARSVMKKVKAVALVVGREDIPEVPRNEDDLRLWYIKHSIVVVPESHPFVVEGKFRKRHGKISPYDEVRSVKLLTRALPDIKVFIENKLAFTPIAPLLALNSLNDITKTALDA